MLSPRAIAMQGVGSAVLVLALQGLVGVPESQPAASVVGGGARQIAAAELEAELVREHWDYIDAIRRAHVTREAVPGGVAAKAPAGLPVPAGAPQDVPPADARTPEPLPATSAAASAPVLAIAPREAEIALLLAALEVSGALPAALRPNDEDALALLLAAAAPSMAG